MKPTLSLFLVMILVLILFGCSPSAEENKISPAIRYKGNILYIKNTDTVIYDSVKVEINGAFKKTLPLSIPCGQEYKYQLSTFMKDDGERFNIFKHGLRDISISCELSDLRDNKWVNLGKAFWHGKFN